jgi:hypothetical protein
VAAAHVSEGEVAANLDVHGGDGHVSEFDVGFCLGPEHFQSVLDLFPTSGASNLMPTPQLREFGDWHNNVVVPEHVP